MSETSTSKLEKIRNPNKEYPYAIGPSGLHGIGIFASGNIPANKMISIFCWKGNEDNSYIRDETCRFCNHSGVPNAFIRRDEKGNFSLHASKLIQDGEEIYVNYPHSVSYMLRYGVFELPHKVRCRTLQYVKYAKDKKGRFLTDELREIGEGKWK